MNRLFASMLLFFVLLSIGACVVRDCHGDNGSCSDERAPVHCVFCFDSPLTVSEAGGVPVFTARLKSSPPPAANDPSSGGDFIASIFNPPRA